MIKKVTEGIYRGARPSDDDFILLKTFGIKTIIDLENDKDAIGHESHVTRKLGIDFECVEMSEIKRPSVNELIWAVGRICQSEKPVYVHCLHGCDRTGYAIAAYRILKESWAFEKAWEELIENGHKWLFYFWWKKSLKELLEMKRIKNLFEIPYNKI